MRANHGGFGREKLKGGVSSIRREGGNFISDFLHCGYHETEQSEILVFEGVVYSWRIDGLGGIEITLYLRVLSTD